MAPLYLSEEHHYVALVDKYDTFLFDCDGVLYGGPLGDELTPNVAETLSHLRLLGKSVAFITNNATKSRQGYLAKFKALGLAVSLDEIFTCGSASASYLRTHVLPELGEEMQGIYVVGQQGLEEELHAEGLDWSGGSDPEDHEDMPYQDFSDIIPDQSIGVVLFSFQMRLNYKMLSKAYNYLATNPHCKLVLTNDDANVLIPGGSCPGEGAMASVLFSARKNLVPIIVGKPHQPLLDIVHEALKFDPARTVMVGDRLETDVLFGKRGGVSTLLVLTGSSTTLDLVGLPTEHEPDYITACVGDLLRSRVGV